jgi:hypothetical protein
MLAPVPVFVFECECECELQPSFVCGRVFIEANTTGTSAFQGTHPPLDWYYFRMHIRMYVFLRPKCVQLICMLLLLFFLVVAIFVLLLSINITFNIIIVVVVIIFFFHSRGAHKQFAERT